MVLYEVVSDMQVGEWRGDVIKVSDVDDFWEGVAAEYQYLEDKFGERGKHWWRRMQYTINEGDFYYDRLDLAFSDGSEKVIYFDITSFYGVWPKDWEREKESRPEELRSFMDQLHSMPPRARITLHDMQPQPSLFEQILMNPEMFSRAKEIGIFDSR